MCVDIDHADALAAIADRVAVDNADFGGGDVIHRLLATIAIREEGF